MEEQQELILKIIYGSTKFKQSVKYSESNLISFAQLKQQIYEQLLKLNSIKSEKVDQIQLSDSDDFLYVDTDNINSYLKNNDIINVKFIQEQKTEKQEPIETPNVQAEQQQEQAQQKLQQEEPKEAICVLYDTSGSMSGSFYNDPLLSRIGAVNSWFSAFADKTLVFEFNHLVQLICFASDIKVRCEFNSDFEKFIQLVDDVKATGSTKLYDAIGIAIQNLLEIKKKYPKIILRIIALTDGEDNQSSNSPQNLVKQIIQNKIIIDSFVVGENCVGLKTLTHASGGRCYCPKELSQGMQLFEIETILSVEARDIGSEGFDPNIDLKTLKDKPFDTEGIKQSQKQLKQQAEKPEVFLKKMQEEQKKSEAGGSKVAFSGASKRIFKELNDYINAPVENTKIFPSKDNNLLWKALLIGPKGTSYNLGCYMLSIDFPSDYPFQPPKVKFLTQIYHCNISQQGSLCLSLLRDQWSPAITVSKVFLAILELLQTPNPDDALESSISSLMMHEKEKFQEKVIEETLKFANQDAGTLVQQILGGDLNAMNLDEFQNLKEEIDQWMKKNRA